MVVLEQGWWLAAPLPRAFSLCGPACYAGGQPSAPAVQDGWEGWPLDQGPEGHGPGPCPWAARCKSFHAHTAPSHMVSLVASERGQSRVVGYRPSILQSQKYHWALLDGLLTHLSGSVGSPWWALVTRGACGCWVVAGAQPPGRDRRSGPLQARGLPGGSTQMSRAVQGGGVEGLRPEAGEPGTPLHVPLDTRPRWVE